MSLFRKKKVIEEKHSIADFMSQENKDVIIDFIIIGDNDPPLNEFIERIYEPLNCNSCAKLLYDISNIFTEENFNYFEKMWSQNMCKKCPKFMNEVFEANENLQAWS